MKSLVELLEHLLLDCERRSGAPLRRDVETLRARAKHEGDSFITITLPNFCKDFERSLEEGRIGPGLFLSFGKTHSGIPEFLQGLLSGVFGPDGSLLHNPSIDCIRFVRQICLFGKKIQRPCSPERELDAIEGFVRCDDDIVSVLPENQFLRIFRIVSREIFSSLDLEQASILADLEPKHGPGATCEKISGNQKFVHKRWHDRLTNVGFTYTRFGRSSQELHQDEIVDWPIAVEPGAESPVRVVSVPKTLKAPRLIAVEPVCMQYAQQGLSRLLVERLRSSRFTSGHVNFTDQSVNQALALSASGSRYYATMDMAEASDRVSIAHVSEMLSSVPDFRDWVFACRSTRAQLPNGETFALKKFASMGSALCFPMEAMVFFVSIITSMAIRAGICPTARDVFSLGRRVFVYGDDIIVPSDEASAICDDLEAFGFKVNRRKSFWNGKFRESCGSDCYDREQVTPVYLRRDSPTGRKDAQSVVSNVATANQLEEAGYTETAAALREAVETAVGPLPHVSVDSTAIGWRKSSYFVPPKRWNCELQRREYLCWVAVAPCAADPLEGDAALVKCLPRIIRDPFGLRRSDEEHLERSSRPYSLTLKRRWVSAAELQ